AAGEHVVAGQKVLVKNVEGGGHQPGGIDGRVSAEHDAVGIDDEHLARGQQHAVDAAHGGARDAVERHRLAAVRLVEYDPGPPADAERIPFDDDARVQLLDDQFTDVGVRIVRGRGVGHVGGGPEAHVAQGAAHLAGQ